MLRHIHRDIQTYIYINRHTALQGYTQTDKNANICTHTLTQHRYIHAQRYTGRQAGRHTPPEPTQPCPGIRGAKRNDPHKSPGTHRASAQGFSQKEDGGVGGGLPVRWGRDLVMPPAPFCAF